MVESPGRRLKNEQARYSARNPKAPETCALRHDTLHRQIRERGESTGIRGRHVATNDDPRRLKQRMAESTGTNDLLARVAGHVARGLHELAEFDRDTVATLAGGPQSQPSLDTSEQALQQAQDFVAVMYLWWFLRGVREEYEPRKARQFSEAAVAGMAELCRRRISDEGGERSLQRCREALRAMDAVDWSDPAAPIGDRLARCFIDPADEPPRAISASLAGAVIPPAYRLKDEAAGLLKGAMSDPR